MTTIDDEERQDLYESAFADAILRLEDVGWNRLGIGSDFEADELSLNSVKEISATTRGLVALNPLAKRGVSVRTSYVWGKGIEFKGIELTDPILTDPLLRTTLFSTDARSEMEKALATDGNFYFIAKGKSQRRYDAGKVRPSGFRVPISEIEAIVANPDNREEVWFYRRDWVRHAYNNATGQEETKNMKMFYPTDLYLEFLSRNSKRMPNKIGDILIAKDEVIFVHSVNKQVGWRVGMPDLTPAIFWIRAHKEFLEDQAKLVKSYSRYTWKATAVAPRGVSATAASVAQPAASDGAGGRSDVGATAVMPQGANLQSIGRTGGSVDFSAGLPLAGYVASALEIPLTDLTSDSSLSNRSAAESLSESKLAAMIQRQNSWVAFYERLFKFWGKNVTPYFERIEEESPVKQIQGVTAAMTSNVLYPEEVRAVLVKALGIQDAHSDKLPTEKDLGLLILAAKQAEKQADKAAAVQKSALSQKNKAQGDASYGDNSNRADAGGQHTYTDGNDGR